MITQTERCGRECDCPSKLHHELAYIVARIDAPILSPPRDWIVSELRNALTDDTARDEER